MRRASSAIRSGDNGGAPSSLRPQNRSNCRLMVCPGFGQNLSQRPTEVSTRPVTPDRRNVDLEVSSIDAVTLSDREVGRTRA